MGEAEGGVVEEGARGLTSSSAVESEADAGAPPLVEAPSARSYQAPEGLVEQDDLEVMGRGGRSAVFWLLSVGVVVLLLGVGAVFASTGFVLFAKRQPPEAVGAESEPEAQPGVADDSDGPSEDGDGAGVAQEVEQVGLNGAKSVGKAADEGSGDEAPAVAVKAGEFKVSLSSAPEGATIWRGDEKVGVTPMDVTLPPETTWPAVFLLTAPGRSSVYAVVEAPEEGQAALKSEHQLEPAGRGVARIEVLTETAGAEVFEEGVLVGFTPVHLARPRREGSVALSIVYDDQTTRKLRVGLGAQDVVLKVPDDKTADARPVAPRR